MNSIKPRTTVEIFHLLFIEQLGKSMDKTLYAIKGGCNLRFFYHSIRYSEDIDIDISKIAKETLQKKINRILTSQQFQQILKSKNILIDSFSESKQTQTTQRWKIQLKLIESDFIINTKIEFSRRGMKQGLSFASVDKEVLMQYKLRPILASHYDIETAFEQKLDALISRSQTQARDVFDLDLLLTLGAVGQNLSKSTKNNLHTAQKNALSISFEEFQSQVVAYLPLDYHEQYDSQEVWNLLLSNLLGSLAEVEKTK